MYEEPLPELDSLYEKSNEFKEIKSTLDDNVENVDNINNQQQNAEEDIINANENEKENESDEVFLEKPTNIKVGNNKMLNTQNSLSKIDKLLKSVNLVKVRNQRANMRMKILAAMENKKANMKKQMKIKKRLPKFPKVVELPNPKIPKEDPNMIFYGKCEEKSGYLKIVRNPKVLPNELQLYKIYVEMDLQNLNMYLDHTGARTLFNSVHLTNIMKLSQQKLLAPFNCFDFQLHDVDHSASTLLNGPVTLCAKDEDDMQSWIDAIQEFMQCRVDPSNPKDKQVIANYVKVNQLLKDKFGNGSGSEKDSLYYDNTNTINRHPKAIEQDHVVSKAFGKIFDTIQEGNIRRRQLQRKMNSKLQEAKSMADDMAQRQEIMQQILQRRLQKEKEKENNLLKGEEKKKQMRLLKAVQKKIFNMEKDQINNFGKELKKQIGDQQKKSNDQAAKMMKSIADQNKLRKYEDCMTTRLLYFDDTPYVEALCKRYYGEHVYK